MSTQVRLRAAGAGTVLIALGLAYAGPSWSAVLVALLGFHAGTRRATGWWYAGMALATVAVLLVAADRAGLTAADLGLTRVGRGLLLSVAVLAVVGGALLVLRHRTVGHRVAGLAPTDHLARRLLVDLPIGTVLLEEMAFRSVGLALLVTHVSTGWAVLLSSVAFGGWHVWGAVESHDPDGRLSRPLAVGGTVVITAGAGAALCVVRLATGSVLPAMALHYAANGAGLGAPALARRLTVGRPQA